MKAIELIQKLLENNTQSDLLLLAGPCQIESLEHCKMMAEKILEATSKLPVQVVFKSSFDKANRTSIESKRGLGLEKGVETLAAIKKEFSIPVITDIHLPEHAELVAKHVDILQIPAFLCRQTDLLIAAGKTQSIINLKKGQFLHPSDMAHAAEKINSTGNKNILMCERGTCFGYRDLVVDMRSIKIMSEIGYPVVFDATHSVASMGGASGSSGGSREFIPTLAKAAIAAGAHGLFIECHEEPSRAPSDGACMLPIEGLQPLLESVCNIRAALNG